MNEELLDYDRKNIIESVILNSHPDTMRDWINCLCDVHSHYEYLRIYWNDPWFFENNFTNRYDIGYKLLSGDYHSDDDYIVFHYRKENKLISYKEEELINYVKDALIILIPEILNDYKHHRNGEESFYYDCSDEYTKLYDYLLATE